MDTIAALATAPFKAAIGVIRMSGPEAFSIAEACLRFPGSGRLIAEDRKRNVAFAYLHDRGEVVDEVVVTAFRGPYSYTGEDTVEFSCHGGVYLLDRVLRLLFSKGARQALGGEFTKRAFLNGKSDLTRAEGVMDLIDAEYSSAARAAMSELDGTVGNAIGEIRGQILAITAKLLAYVDYPDDEIGEVSTEEIDLLLTEALTRVRTLTASYGKGKILREGVRTALCGRPNVGKSSLMNLFAGENRSIVTDIAGTTRDTVTESVVFGGVKLLLTDTAGIRETEDRVEKIGVDRAVQAMEKADLILCVFGDHPDEQDRVIGEKALQYQGKTLFLFNKSDLYDAPLPAWASAAPSFRISAVTGDGMPKLEACLADLFATDLPAGSAVITNGRQYQCLCRIESALARASDNLTLTPDVIVSDLEEALAAVGEITGERVSDSIVHEIFSRFCVGK
ncbi:MAG: tRNA uridine-5-carboxymethylaminomethyl(34) synthesis GTPase MnmE [Clostridia bacterium]|nr:tRNA uridine-5-carboxymethylaminomethyl(34) synthesis GTPase MnmE [Clostridia bacterium]